MLWYLSKRVLKSFGDVINDCAQVVVLCGAYPQGAAAGTPPQAKDKLL
jgi:hypothetical protein